MNKIVWGLGLIVGLMSACGQLNWMPPVYGVVLIVWTMIFALYLGEDLVK